ncbi:MAG: hypothetical protein JWM11_7777 [Planctomycetaceae bacterium]|nr:hypothetical protein [Planctomycetaceae bacterium]
MATDDSIRKVVMRRPQSGKMNSPLTEAFKSIWIISVWNGLKRRQIRHLAKAVRLRSHFSQKRVIVRGVPYSFDYQLARQDDSWQSAFV